jgi:hypothetical protein
MLRPKIRIALKVSPAQQDCAIIRPNLEGSRVAGGGRKSGLNSLADLFTNSFVNCPVMEHGGDSTAPFVPIASSDYCTDARIEFPLTLTLGIQNAR